MARPRQCYVNEYYFEEIDNEEKAYWLGFLYADGNVYYKEGRLYIVTLLLSKKDLNHIKKFKECLNSEHKIKEYRDIVSIQITSRHLADDLIKWGCVPRKTFKLRKIPNIPEKLIRHFIRGHFDGDGSFGLYKRNDRPSKCIKFTITGTYKFIKEIEEYLVKKGVLKNHNKLTKITENTYKISRGGNIQGIQFLNYLYKNSQIYLERKYNRFLQIKTEIEGYAQS